MNARTDKVAIWVEALGAELVSTSSIAAIRTTNERADMLLQ